VTLYNVTLRIRKLLSLGDAFSERLPIDLRHVRHLLCNTLDVLPLPDAMLVVSVLLITEARFCLIQAVETD